MKNYNALLLEHSDASLALFLKNGSVILHTEPTNYPEGPSATFLVARTTGGEKVVAMVPASVGNRLSIGDKVQELSPQGRDGEWVVRINQSGW